MSRTMAREPSESERQRHKEIAAFAASAFGGPFLVHDYYHDTEPLTVDILRCVDRPRSGVTSYSTIGLSDLPIPWGNEEFPTRIELAGVCDTSAEAYPNILASAAFHMMRSGDVYHPGAVIEGYVELYLRGTGLPYLYFTSPFTWKDLRTFDAGSAKITWLQAMPISQAELDYLKTHGDIALEDVFNKSRIDASDIRRPSAIFHS